MHNKSNLDEVRVRLAAIDGLDLEQGLESALDRFEFYIELLTMFAKNHGDDPEQLRSLIETGDHSIAQGLAHTLKGAAGIIGAKQVYRMAAAAQVAGRSEAPGLEASILALADALEDLVYRLEQALGQS